MAVDRSTSLIETVAGPTATMTCRSTRDGHVWEILTIKYARAEAPTLTVH